MKIKPIPAIFSLILSLLCAGCSVILSPAKSAGPLLEQAPLSLTQVYISTQLATLETLVAQLTVDAQNSPTSEPTQAATMTSTSLPTMTLAPFPIVVPTPIPAPPISPTPPAYRCEILSQSPYKKTFAPNEDFDARWLLKNTGTSHWDANIFDYQHLSGEMMDKHGDIFDLPSTIEPGKQFNILVDMKAPSQPGRYIATWGVTSGSLRACSMDLVIFVR
jgi:hypothetical protein